ncbi:MAG: hypothetical protein HGB06_04020 [Chlorobaculum sp.]|jgi:hypothetical protein|nr:hypothetical protein [Chlorobaculum sp.]
MGENMSKTEMHPIGLWASFFEAIGGYRDFLQGAVERGADAGSVDGRSFVRNEKAAKLLMLCQPILDQEYRLSPLDGNLLELESYCRGQGNSVKMLMQSAIWFQANRLRKQIHDLKVPADEVGRVMQAIQYRLVLDERQKVVENYLYANALDEWFQGVKNAEPAEHAAEPAAVDGAAADQDNEFASNIKRFKGQRGLPMSVITTECRKIAEREMGNLRRGVKGLIEMLVAENGAVLREVYPNSKNLVSFVYGHCKSDEKIKEIAREHSGSKRQRRE